MMKLKLQYFGHLMQTADSLEKSFSNAEKKCWERLRAEGEEGKLWEMVRDTEAGMLQSMGLQRFGHDWATEQQQKECKTKNSENFIMIMQGKRECQGKLRFKTSLNSLEGEERWNTEQGTWGHQALQGGAFDNFQDRERKTVKIGINDERPSKR